MEQRAIKLDFAIKMAEELWERYVNSPEPSKRRVYGLRYEFWANVREKLEEESKPIEG